MQFDFLTDWNRGARNERDILVLGSRTVPIHFTRRNHARRYILRVHADGSVRATIPRRGSVKEARAFAERSIPWIEEQIQNRQARTVVPSAWQHGTEILYRGEKVTLVVGPNHSGHMAQFADETVAVGNPSDVRPAIERHLWNAARHELTTRTLALAAAQGTIVKQVTVRNQRSRWGSCSRRGTISLNWRLIQTPVFVRDYIILHELMHMKEMNHSRRFWRLVEQACPGYEEAERWLKKHRGLLR